MMILMLLRVLGEAVLICLWATPRHDIGTIATTGLFTDHHHVTADKRFCYGLRQRDVMSSLG